MQRHATSYRQCHCTQCLPYVLQEAAHKASKELDPVAGQIGAVNTLIRQQDGSFKGYNTGKTGVPYAGFNITPPQTPGVQDATLERVLEIWLCLVQQAGCGHVRSGLIPSILPSHTITNRGRTCCC
jgi:hypothetical protein